MLDEWYSPKEITFTRDQVLWILRHLEMMREGNYPPEPSSGYTEPLGKKRTRRGAYFETPCVIVAEVDWRLERTGIDGKLLLAEVKAEYTYFSQEAWTALNYISGWKRKKTPYSQWKASRNYYKKVIKH